MDLKSYKDRFDKINDAYYTYDYYSQAEDGRLLPMSKDVSREKFEENRKSNNERFDIPAGSIRYGDKGTVVIEKYHPKQYNETYTIYDDFIKDFIEYNRIVKVDEFMTFIEDYVEVKSMDIARNGKSMDSIRCIMDIEDYLIELFKH